MEKLRCRGKRSSQLTRITEFFMSILISLFVAASWGVRRRRRFRARPPKLHSNNRTRRRRSRAGSGCGCCAIIILIPLIILFGGLVLFRAEITDFIYQWTGFRIP